MNRWPTVPVAPNTPTLICCPSNGCIDGERAIDSTPLCKFLFIYQIGCARVAQGLHHQTTMSTAEETAAQLIYAPNVQHNQNLTTVKFLSSCFAGAVAGILGLENWLGFALFFTSTLLTSACIYAINCKGRPAKYLQGGLSELINPGQDNAFTFILVWTLFFGTRLCICVHKSYSVGLCGTLGVVHGKA